MTRHLWVNVGDIHSVGLIPGFGSPLMFMIIPSLGDELLPGAWLNPGGKVDECYVVIHSTGDRCDAIRDAMELIGNKRMGRRVRTRLTVNAPRCPPWSWVSGVFRLPILRMPRVKREPVYGW